MKIILYSILCKEKFYNLLVTFFNGKYTKRCAVSRATTYLKFSLKSFNLMLHSRATLKIDDRNCILIFFKFGFFLIKDGFQKLLELVHFVKKKILYHLRYFAPQIIEL
jgi:hypothetical protein